MNWPLLLNSLLVAGATTALAVGFGVVAALWRATLGGRSRVLFLGLAVVALALPPFLVTNCWLDLLGDTGALRRWLPLRIYSPGGTVWMLALMLWPITTLAVAGAWRRLEAEQFECDPALRGWALLRWLLLPAARGELTLAAIVTFVLALNNFAVPTILQTRVLTEELWIRFNSTFFQTAQGGFDFAALARVAWPLVVLPAIVLAWLSRYGVGWPRVRGSASPENFRRQLGSRWRMGCGAMAMLLVVLSVGLPLAQIALTKRTWTELPGAVGASAGAIWNSFRFAALAATAVVVAALGVVTVASRKAPAAQSAMSQRLRTSAATMVTAVGWLPFFIPGVVLGVALIQIVNRPPWLAFYQGAGIVVLAFAIRYFALAWTATRHAVASVDRDLTDAATLEGATRWQSLRLVVWPQIAPQVLAAGYAVYLLCLWDVESMILIYPPGGDTLALNIFNFLHYGHAAQVNALCVALLGLAVLPLVVWRLANWARNMTSKHPPPSSKGIPGSKLGTLLPGALIGAWCFCSGCAPAGGKSEAPLSSHLFERAFVIGSRGVGIGEFNKPRSVACDTAGDVYAVDMTGRVQKFSPAGQFLLTWQMPQTDLGKPKGMAQGRDGGIFIIEPHYQRVNRFTPEGKLLAQWGCRGTNAGCFVLPRGIAENSRGEFWVSEYMGMERVQKFAQPSPLTPLPSDGSGEQGASASLNGPPLTSALASSEGEVEKRVQATVSSVAPQLLQVIGRAGTGAGEFNRAEGIGVDAQDRLYVADSCNHRIQVFSADGKFVRQYGRAGSGLGELSYPYDIAVDAQGYQFVCEFGNSRIQVFDADCRPVEIIGGPGSEPGRFANPWGVALDAQGNLYVADAMNHRVQKLVRRMGRMGQMRPMEVEASNDGSRITRHALR